MAEIDDVMSAVKELRNEVEKKSADQEKINKLQSALDASEKKNQELVKKQAELENAQREIAAKQEEIEKLAKASGDNSERIKELEKKLLCMRQLRLVLLMLGRILKSILPSKNISCVVRAAKRCAQTLMFRAVIWFIRNLLLIFCASCMMLRRFAHLQEFAAPLKRI